MSVAMTNCGRLGWVTDRRGYRYDTIDPATRKPWPSLPASFHDLATRAAAAAGFGGFDPDACLVNRYEPGTRLSMHQDRNERDFGAPIVSVSLGLPAVFLFGARAGRIGRAVSGSRAVTSSCGEVRPGSPSTASRRLPTAITPSPDGTGSI